jgi:DNA repair exonuclease SbcCD nuclease subunit
MGHFELPHFKMNANVVMPDHGSLQDNHFGGVDKVFSGHFHMRQQRNNIHYIGNCFPHNFGDSGDDRRGMMVLEWGSEPEYFSWENQPLYRVLTLSDLLDRAPAILRPRMNTKVELDISISYEEASFIKETYVKDYGLREMSLVPLKKNIVDEDMAPGELKFESVDQVVTSQITALESDYYDPKLLLSIYQALN